MSFDARVDGYVKGYERDGYDYKLSRHAAKQDGLGMPQVERG